MERAECRRLDLFIVEAYNCSEETAPSVTFARTYVAPRASIAVSVAMARNVAPRRSSRYTLIAVAVSRPGNRSVDVLMWSCIYRYLDPALLTIVH